MKQSYNPDSDREQSRKIFIRLVCHSDEGGIPASSSTKIDKSPCAEWIDPEASGHSYNIFCSSGTVRKKILKHDLHVQFVISTKEKSH